MLDKKQLKYDKAYLRIADEWGKLSYCKRKQVGAIIVKDNRIISIGYNGMPSGWDNECEDIKEQHDIGTTILFTKPEVLHAETNAIAKLAQSSESGKDATLFCTHLPCMDCAKLIYQSGIKQVFYRDNYRSDAGTAFLKQAGITVNKVEE